MVLILIGLGSVVQTVLGGGHDGGYLSINFGFALGVVFGIYVCGVGGSGKSNCTGHWLSAATHRATAE